jgi:rubredoxin
MTEFLIVPTRWTCPECRVTFTDPEQWAFGHDCEV